MYIVFRFCEFTYAGLIDILVQAQETNTLGNVIYIEWGSFHRYMALYILWHIWTFREIHNFNWNSICYYINGRRDIFIQVDIILNYIYRKVFASNSIWQKNSKFEFEHLQILLNWELLDQDNLVQIRILVGYFWRSLRRTQNLVLRAAAR